MDMGHVKVDAELVRLGSVKVPTENDSNSFLKMAASCIILALCAKARILTQTSGEIADEKFRDVAYRFQRTSPMFFFASGTSKGFQELLSDETLRMMFYSFLRAYLDRVFYETHKRITAKPKVARDATSRGAYWNEGYDVSDLADSKYGDILEEW